MLGEDVEDQRGPVDDLDLDPVLEVAQLAGRELAVADHGVGAGGLHDLAQPVDLAAADVRRGVGRLPALVERVEHLGAGGLGEQRELGHGVLGVLDGAVGPDPDQHDPLEAQLAVLDLGDVLELGGQPGTRRRAWRSARSCSPLVSSGSPSSYSSSVPLSAPSSAYPDSQSSDASSRVSATSSHAVLVPAGGLGELGVEGEVLVCVRHMPSSVGRSGGQRTPLSRRRTALLPSGASGAAGAAGASGSGHPGIRASGAPLEENAEKSTARPPWAPDSSAFSPARPPAPPPSPADTVCR